MSPRHKEWVRQVAEALNPHFEEVRFLDYDHWDVNGAEMDVEHELARAAELAKDYGEYMVVAKSIATVLTTLGNARGLLTPKHCVFLGFPLQVVHELPQELELASALKQLPPTTFVHNQNDPLGTAEAVQTFIAAHAPANYDFQTTPGATHDYVDFGLIARLAAVN
jgi:acetyl esterase/lipase